MYLSTNLNLSEYGLSMYVDLSTKYVLKYILKANGKNCSKSEIQLKLARKADNRLFLSFAVKKVVESV